MSKAKSGQGPQKSVQMKLGKPAKGVSPQATARIGIETITSTGVTKVPGPNAKPLGNELAKNVGKGGPGAGRTVHPNGSQNKSPTAQPMSGTGAGWPWTKGN